MRDQGNGLEPIRRRRARDGFHSTDLSAAYRSLAILVIAESAGPGHPRAIRRCRGDRVHGPNTGPSSNSVPAGHESTVR